MDFRDEQAAWSARAQAAQGLAAHALQRLMVLAESSKSGQIRTVARFIASVYDGQTFPLDPFDLRTVDVPISDDMLLCLDALRWGKSDLHNLVPDGNKRILAICSAWSLEWPET